VKIDAHFLLVSDFVAPQTPMLAHAVLAEGRLNYYAMDKSLLHSDPVPRAQQAELMKD
jgi:hypothetical protein